MIVKTPLSESKELERNKMEMERKNLGGRRRERVREEVDGEGEREGRGAASFSHTNFFECRLGCGVKNAPLRILPFLDVLRFGEGKNLNLENVHMSTSIFLYFLKYSLIGTISR